MNIIWQLLLVYSKKLVFAHSTISMGTHLTPVYRFSLKITFNAPYYLINGILKRLNMRNDIFSDHPRPLLRILSIGKQRQKHILRQNGQLFDGLPCAVAEHDHLPEVLHRDPLLLLPYEVGELRS